MALSTRNGKHRQFEDGVGPFEKRKRSCSWVSEPKGNVAVEEKLTACFPLRQSSSPKLKQCKSPSPSSVNLQSQGLGISHSTKDDDLDTLVHHNMDQAAENLSSCRASRIHLLKLQFSDTILKANMTRKGLPDSPPRKKLMQRMKQRKLARRDILNMEKSVQFEDPLQDLKQLEMLRGFGSGDTFQQVQLGLPLKKLGLYLKEDDELQGRDEETFFNGDWEEGDIHS